MNDDVTQQNRDRGPAKTRRNLLAAAGGFALAASGLALPAWIMETDAREGSFGGRLGGRHGKNRRGRDKNRNNGGNNGGNNGDNNGDNDNKKKKGAPPPPAPPGVVLRANVRWIVENLTASPVDYVGRSLYEEDTKVCRLQALQTVDPNGTSTFQPNNWNAIVRFNNERSSFMASQDYEVDFPAVEASSESTVGLGGCLSGGTLVLTNHLMGVGQKVNVTMEGHQFEILRESDSEGERVFRIKVHS